MKIDHENCGASRMRLGADRVVDPYGVLPQPATRLDASKPVRHYEIEVSVDALYLDSTSFQQLLKESGGREERVADRILEIVAESGKMQNPVTGSGGVFVGSVLAAGAEYESPPSKGARIVSLVSLSQTPLRLTSAGPIDKNTSRVPVKGVAYLPECSPWTTIPNDFEDDIAVSILDVYGAASHTRALSKAAESVLILGAGHAGLLAAAAARDTVGEAGRIVMADVNENACARARDTGLCDEVITVDLRDTVAAVQTLTNAGTNLSDVTVLVVNAEDCELAAILSTREGGSILFFSMATSFTKASLGAEGVARDVRMLMGSGYAADQGSYAFGLVRRHESLLAGFRTP